MQMDLYFRLEEEEMREEDPLFLNRISTRVISMLNYYQYIDQMMKSKKGMWPETAANISEILKEHVNVQSYLLARPTEVKAIN
jgi:hypothetical protein